MCNKSPMGHPTKADEVGKLAWFLASDNSRSITGTHMKIDGGFSLTNYMTSLLPKNGPLMEDSD